MKKEIEYTDNIFDDDDKMPITEFDLTMEEKYGSSTQVIPAPEPKKKTNKKKPNEEIKVTGTEQKDDVWNCRFNLSKKLHQQVKLLSIYKNVSIQKIMEEALKMYIKSQKKELDFFLSDNDE